MDEVLKTSVIEALSVVSSVSFHVGNTTHKVGYHVNLRCSAVSSYGDCDTQQVETIRMSSKCPSLIDCLPEFGQGIQRDHGPTCVPAVQKLQDVDEHDTSTRRPDEKADSLNATEVLILHTKMKIIQERAAQENKVVLEEEKVRDEFHNQIEQIEQWMYPRRTHTDDDAGDTHEMLAEVDNGDL